MDLLQTRIKFEIKISLGSVKNVFSKVWNAKPERLDRQESPFSGKGEKSDTFIPLMIWSTPSVSINSLYSNMLDISVRTHPHVHSVM